MERTVAQIAQTKSRSLRTTIPATYARQLGIEDKTPLDWDLKPNGGGFLLIVRVAPPEPTEKPRTKAARGKGGHR